MIRSSDFLKDLSSGCSCARQTLRPPFSPLRLPLPLQPYRENHEWGKKSSQVVSGKGGETANHALSSPAGHYSQLGPTEGLGCSVEVLN